ncbi:MAG: SufB/SufD family protein [Anaeroplasma sp.]
MSNKITSFISAMGQAENGDYIISENNDKIIIVDASSNIYVSKGVNVNILDITCDKKIIITSEENSKINYTIINSSNSKREFNINGELNINQISLFSTNEALDVNLFSSNASCDIKLLCAVSNESAHFNQTIKHFEKYTYSNITNVGISMNSASIIFDTTGKIEKGMAKSKCSQLSRGIVMDDNSLVTAKPILLIDEYDCFANHGASIGKMSDDDLFYLMSRGLSKKDAFLLILQGIIKPYIDNIPLDEWKDKIETEIQNLIEK